MAFKAKELNIAGFIKFFSNAPSSPSSSPSSASTSASTTSSTPASTLTPSSCSSPIPPGDLRGPQGPQGGLGSATSGTGVDGKLCCPRKKSHCNITLRKQNHNNKFGTIFFYLQGFLGLCVDIESFWMAD